EMGYFARNYKSEKKPVKEQKALSNNDKSKNVSYANAEYEDDSWDQKELVYIFQTPQHQSYIKDYKETKQKQSESEKENALLKKTPKVPPTFETPDQKDSMDITVNFPIESKIVVVTFNSGRSKTLGIVENIKIMLQGIVIPIDLQVIKSMNETLLLGTDWFAKSCTTLNFGNHTLHIKYAGKQATINTTHTSTTLLFPIKDTDEKDDDQWRPFFSDEATMDFEDWLFYNPWENEVSPAICLVETIDGMHQPETPPNYNIGQEVTPRQKEAAYKLLLQNHE
ncbi:3483_t:CDS:2, partial [Dentiscutata erythropus]